MEGTLSRGDDVGVRGVEREERTAVVQHDPGSRHHAPAAEAGEERLDHRDGVAFLVDDREIDGVTIPVTRPVARSLGDDGVAPNAPRQIARIGLRQEPFQWDLGEGRVGDVAVAIGIRQFGPFDQCVHIVRRCAPHRRQLLLFGEVEHLQEGCPLRVGRECKDPLSEVRGADRLLPRGGVSREVGGGEQSPLALHEGRQHAGQGAAIEGTCSLVGDCSKRVSEFALHQNRPWCRRLAVDQKGASQGAVGGDLLHLGGDIEGEARRDGKSTLGVANRRLQCLLQCGSPESTQGVLPRLHGTGDRDRKDPSCWHRLQSLC